MATGIGRVLIVVGLVIVVLWLALTLAGRIPWLGKLPGDIIIERGNLRIYFPLMTSIIISLALTLLLNIIIRLFR